ncbi:ActS/PrrB/RegB family redox-sensitive histidine kinase [Paracoccus aeridis]|uniref:ActS/PrrB/RegB family redox-sensitive histidine kinase n=1 Tax=Paracoccus aeridis TaxID=1966466 RepID=UPI0010A9DE45|nr:ActS/PrrB/RegB family redox-sensitive histidine kinase [Paracoccus aeridis]
MPAPPSGLSPLLMPGPRAEPIRLRTLIALRWVAVAGQLAAVATAWMIGARFPIGPALALIGLYAAANTMLAARGAPVTARRARHHLAMDAVQLGLLLTLTGGTTNPFAPLMLVPVTIGAAALRMSDTLPLAVLTVALVTLTALAGIPLEFVAGAAVPPRIALQLGDWLALLISAAFFVVYVGRVSTELSATSQALFATQLALSREQRLQHLGGIVAAAAHEMGTPLATIKLVGSELQDELQDLLPDRPGVAEDLRLLRASADRCRDILRSMGDAGKDDLHLRTAPLGELLSEAADPHRGRGKAIAIDAGEIAGLDVRRDPGIVHGLRNLIQNGADFARSAVTITAAERVEGAGAIIAVVIADDGPGFPPAMVPRLGDPFLTARRAADRTGGAEGMGLGLFIARTLLERSGAAVAFSNGEGGGARVEVTWPRGALAADARAPLGDNPAITG